MGNEQRLLRLGTREALKQEQDTIKEKIKTFRKAILTSLFADEPEDIDSGNILVNAKSLEHYIKEYQEKAKKIKELNEELGIE